MVEPPELTKWPGFVDSIGKALGATSLAILGKEILKYWRASRDRQFKANEELVSKLLIRVAELETRLDSAQRDNLLALEKLAASYDERLLECQQEAARMRVLYFATYQELVRQGYRGSGGGAFTPPLLET